MVKIFETISNPWLAIALACGTIAYGLYVIVFTKQKSKSWAAQEYRKSEATKSDSETIKSINQNLNSVVTLLKQIDSRLKSFETEFGERDARIFQTEVPGSRAKKIIQFPNRLGQSSWSN